MKRIIKLICVIVVCMGMLLPMGASARGVAPGSGGGPDVPLYLRDSSVADGEKEVSTDVTITLYYSHNVADAAVQKNNRAAIRMEDGRGRQVPLTVSFSDVFEYRQEIYVQPGDLAGGETYTITISPDMMSRNGYRTGTTDHISFTTREELPKEEAPQKPDVPASKPESERPSKPEKETAENNPQDSLPDKKDPEPQSAKDRKEDQTKNVEIERGDADRKTQKIKADTPIEEQKLKEAVEAGIVEETAEKEIEKVSDKKPGKVNPGEEKDTAIRAKEKKSDSCYVLGGCLILAGCIIAAQILHRRMKEYGRNI